MVCGIRFDYYRLLQHRIYGFRLAIISLRQTRHQLKQPFLR